MRSSTFLLAATLLLAGAGAFAQPATPATDTASPMSTEHAPGRPYFGPGERFSATSGAEIYQTVCIGCHMAGGKGAIGAGAYPALANDPKLATSTYALYIVVNGRKAMPPFGNAFDDAQVAEIVNYVTTNFGNKNPTPITAADVKSVRPAPVAKP